MSSSLLESPNTLCPTGANQIGLCEQGQKERTYQKSKIWGESSLISTHRSSVCSSLSSHAWRIVAADASPSAGLTSFRSMIVRFGQTSSKYSGITAGEPPADGGNGPPAMGPGTGNRGQARARAHVGRGKGADQKLAQSRGLARGSGCS